MEAALSGAGGWTTFAFILLFLFVFSVTFTRYYQDRLEAEYLATAVTVLGLFFCLVTVAIVPVDIYFVSSTTDPETGLKHTWATPEVVDQMFTTVKGTYYAFYSGVAILSFAVIPFAYFYFEEYEEGQSTRERVVAALQYTIYTVVIIAILLIVGFFLNPNENDKVNLGWFKKLMTASGGERSLTFLIAVMTLVGMLIYISYTAYGLSIFPILMIKGNRVTASDDLDVQSCLATNREKQNAITSKYMNTTATIIQKDQKALKALEKEERILLRRATAIGRKRKGWVNRFLAVLRPFEFVFGIGFLILSGLIFVSILLTSIDKISNNICGSQCGYLLSHPLIFNPINHVFLKLAKFFPLDYLFFVLVVIYFFACTMAGIVNVGIRFLWVTMFKIRRGSTPPQALLFTTVILMLSLLALNYTVTSLIAPQYAQFGTQKYCNFTLDTVERNCIGHEEYIIPCDIAAPTELCTPTALSDLINRITVSTPFFGAAYFYAQWLFMIVVILGFLWATFRPKQTDVEEEELEDDERALLAERQRHGGSSRAGRV